METVGDGDSAGGDSASQRFLALVRVKGGGTACPCRHRGAPAGRWRRCLPASSRLVSPLLLPARRPCCASNPLIKGKKKRLMMSLPERARLLVGRRRKASRLPDSSHMLLTHLLCLHLLLHLLLSEVLRRGGAGISQNSWQLIAALLVYPPLCSETLNRMMRSSEEQ